MFKINKYNILGIYFLILQILILIRNHFFLENNLLIFHYCDHIALLLSIAFFIRNIPLIKALISTGLILQIIYILDLISIYIFNFELTGTTLFLKEFTLFPIIINLLMHLTTLFIALYFTYKEKNKNISIFYGLIYISILFFSTTLFTTQDSEDYNCIYEACGIEFLNFNYFTEIWILIGFILIFIPTHYLQELIYKLATKK